MAANAALYAHAFSTSPLESINSRIHRSAPKRIDLPGSYLPRADTALLVYAIGHEVSGPSMRTRASHWQGGPVSAPATLVGFVISDTRGHVGLCGAACRNC
jgi:hypothetical protein